jgi:hypothetical protein
MRALEQKWNTESEFWSGPLDALKRWPMCNLYSMTKNVDAIRRLFGVDVGNDRTGNLPSIPGIFPDYPAPIVRNGEAGRELVMARWGMPSSQKALMDATKRRAEKLEAKGKSVDFKQLLRMEPDAAPPTSATSAALTGSVGSHPPIAVWCRSPLSANTTPSTVRRCRCGLQLAMIDRCSPLRACGRTGRQCAR